MGEISDGSDDSIDLGGTVEVSLGVNEFGSPLEGNMSSEPEIDNSLAFDLEINSLNGIESISSANEEVIPSYEISYEMNHIQETPKSLEREHNSIINHHFQSVRQILEANGKYMSEADRDRVSQGANSIKAVEYNVAHGCTGYYMYVNGKSCMEVSVINDQQIERSTKHETNHFASKNREIIVPLTDRNGYIVYQTLGTRQASWFHSIETGNDSEFNSKGNGLNEGLTTMYTNQQLMELSKEKGETAERQGVYSHATELCNQLELIVGKEILKEAYYGGNMQKLETEINQLGGDNCFELLRESFDKTISRDYAKRVEGMKEVQVILEKMYESRGDKV